MHRKVWKGIWLTKYWHLHISLEGQVHLLCTFNIGGTVPRHQRIHVWEHKNVLTLIKMNTNQSWIYFKPPKQSLLCPHCTRRCAWRGLGAPGCAALASSSHVSVPARFGLSLCSTTGTSSTEYLPPWSVPLRVLSLPPCDCISPLQPSEHLASSTSAP